MQFRKIGAIAGSALMAGLTLAGAAMAATNVKDVIGLVKVSDSTVDFPVFVVGADAKTSDVAAAINLAARMAAESKTTAGVVTTTTAIAIDGVTSHMEIEQSGGIRESIENVQKGINAQSSTVSTVLVPKGESGGTETSFLSTGKITISGTDYTWKETVNVTASADVDAAWETSASLSQDNYRKPVVTVQQGNIDTSTGIFYIVKFDKNVTTTNLKGKELYWMGKKYIVQDVKLTTSPKELHLAESGASQAVEAGKSYTVGTHTVDVTSIDITNKKVTMKVTDSAGVSATGTIDDGSSDTINGVNIAVKSGSTGEGYTAAGTKSGVSQLIMGETAVVKKIKDGQKYDGDWYGKIIQGTDTTSILGFGIYYNKARTSSDSLKEGDKISAPDSYFVVKFTGLENTGKSGTATLQVETNYYIDTTQDGTTDAYALKLSETGGTKIFSVSGAISGSADVDTVYMVSNAAAGGAATFYFINSSSGYEAASSTPTVTYTENTFGGFNYTTTTAGGSGWLAITEPTTQSSIVGTFIVEYNHTPMRKFNTTYTLPSGTPDEDTFAYLDWNSTSAMEVSGKTGVWLARSGTNAYQRSDFVSPYGSKLVSAGESLIKIEIPKSRRGVKLDIGKEGATTTTTTGGTVTVLPVTADIAKLDTEMPADLKTITNNLIIMGSPAVNRLAYNLLVPEDKKAANPYPLYGYKWADVGVPIAKDSAIIKVVEKAFNSTKVAVVVAGWEAKDTDLAARVLQAQASKAMVDKNTVTIKGTTVEDIVVS